MTRWSWLQLVLVAAIAVVIGFGFGAIFPVEDIERAVVLAAVVPVVISAACRLGGLRGAWPAAGLSLVGLVLVAGLVVRDPGGLSPEAARFVADGVVNGWQRMLTSPRPAPATDDLVLVAFVVVWLSAAVAAEVALRVRPPLAPSLPLLGGLLATAVLTGGDSFRSDGVLALLLALLAALTLVRTRSTRRLGRLPVRRRDEPGAAPSAPAAAELPMPGRRRQWLFALPVLLLVVVGAPLVGDHLPGAGARPYDPREGRVPPVFDRDLVSPLAGVVAQLRQSPPATVFRVTAPEPQNWRLVTLDRYDGATWSSSSRYVLAGSDLPPSERERATHELVQQYVVEDLAGPWLPAAVRPTATSLDEVAFDASSGAIALPDADAAPPDGYSVTSAVPDYRAAELAGARPASASELPEVAVALEVADGFPAEVAALADRVTASATTDYARLRALQNHLRDSGDYVLAGNGLPGHTYAQVRTFLVGSSTGAGADRADDQPLPGTPEQFATAFALMARYLGYPTRLAVGYRPGTFADGEFTVTTADAHVWPEVALAGLGWVPFDPTPRGADDVPADESLETAQSQADQTPPPPDQEPEVDQDATGSPDGGAQGGGGSWLVAAAGVAFLLVAGTALALVGIVAVKRRRRRRRSHGGARQRVLGAWDEVTDRLRDAGVVVTSRMTWSEVATSSTVGGWPAAAPAIGDLGRLADQARYSRRDVPASAADEAWAAADAVTRTLTEGLAGPSQLRWALDFRSLRPLP